MNAPAPPTPGVPARRRRIARPTRLRLGLAALAAALIGIGCGGGSEDEPLEPASPGAGETADAFPPAPGVGDGPLDPPVDQALDELVRSATEGVFDREALETVAGSGDPRLAWLVSDLLRFVSGGAEEAALVSAFGELTGVDIGEDAEEAGSSWLAVTDHLIAWDLPAPPGYRERKAELFLAVEPAWKPFFDDADSTIDWRLVSWGGVLIDDRPAGDPDPCPRGCIPALDDPALTAASEGGWYDDDRTVFGVVAGGEAVAFPKNIMEVHEMVNVTIGGRRLGIPYCTLCGSAQAYFLDSAPEGVGRPVLRTSGLLSRSNKVMYDLRSRSVLDTFTGRALSGPLQDAGVTLEQTTVVASTWGEWKRAHPQTRIVAEDGGIGRDYPADPLGGRDDGGPIFPVGDVDPRLPVQADVVGVVAPDGKPVAFPVDEALAALAEGQRVAIAGVEAVADGDGVRVRTTAGEELPAHQAFWFAWSQFNPGTELWTPAPGAGAASR
ncbi:MAG: DUF3179 domain-containing (seleno)protein [Solirubrobacterales bacterium]